MFLTKKEKNQIKQNQKETYYQIFNNLFGSTFYTSYIKKMPISPNDFFNKILYKEEINTLLTKYHKQIAENHSLIVKSNFEKNSILITCRVIISHTILLYNLISNSNYEQVEPNYYNDITATDECKNISFEIPENVKYANNKEEERRLLIHENDQNMINNILDPFTKDKKMPLIGGETEYLFVEGNNNNLKENLKNEQKREESNSNDEINIFPDKRENEKIKYTGEEDNSENTDNEKTKKKNKESKKRKSKSNTKEKDIDKEGDNIKEKNKIKEKGKNNKKLKKYTGGESKILNLKRGNSKNIIDTLKEENNSENNNEKSKNDKNIKDNKDIINIDDNTEDNDNHEDIIQNEKNENTKLKELNERQIPENKKDDKNKNENIETIEIEEENKFKDIKKNDPIFNNTITQNNKNINKDIEKSNLNENSKNKDNKASNENNSENDGEKKYEDQLKNSNQNLDIKNSNKDVENLNNMINEEKEEQIIKEDKTGIKNNNKIEEPVKNKEPQNISKNKEIDENENLIIAKDKLQKYDFEGDTGDIKEKYIFYTNINYTNYIKIKINENTNIEELKIENNTIKIKEIPIPIEFKKDGNILPKLFLLIAGLNPNYHKIIRNEIISIILKYNEYRNLIFKEENAMKNMKKIEEDGTNIDFYYLYPFSKKYDLGIIYEYIKKSKTNNNEMKKDLYWFNMKKNNPKLIIKLKNDELSLGNEFDKYNYYLEIKNDIFKYPEYMRNKLIELLKEQKVEEYLKEN